MMAAQRLHEVCMKATQPLHEGHLWSACGTINSGETHTLLTLMSHWPHVILTKAAQVSLQAAGENMGISLATVRWLPHVGRIYEVTFMWIRQPMRPMCGSCAAFVRNVQETIMNDPHASCGPG